MNKKYITTIARDSGKKCELMDRPIHFGSWSCVMCDYYVRHTMHTLDCSNPKYRDKKETI